MVPLVATSCSDGLLEEVVHSIVDRKQRAVKGWETRLSFKGMPVNDLLPPPNLFLLMFPESSKMLPSPGD